MECWKIWIIPILQLSTFHLILFQFMNIKVKLFANLSKYLPPGTKNRMAELEVHPETTAGNVLDQLAVPKELTHLIMINGQHEPRDRVMEEDDLLSVFPPVAGG